MKQCEWSNHQR